MSLCPWETIAELKNNLSEVLCFPALYKNIFFTCSTDTMVGWFYFLVMYFFSERNRLLRILEVCSLLFLVRDEKINNCCCRFYHLSLFPTVLSYFINLCSATILIHFVWNECVGSALVTWNIWIGVSLTLSLLIRKNFYEDLQVTEYWPDYSKA